MDSPKERNPLRLLIFSKDLRFTGGVVNFVSMLVNHLSGRIHYEHFFVGERIKKKSTICKFFLPFYDSIRLIISCSKNKYDLVMLNSSLTATALLRDTLFLLTLHFCKCNKSILFFHGWNNKTEQKIKTKNLIRYLFKFLLNKNVYIIVLASRFKTALVDIGVDSRKIEVLSMMFEGKIFKGIEQETIRRDQKLLFLSRFIREKGVYEVLEAFKEIGVKFPQTSLEMAGDGPELKKLVECARKDNLLSRVTFPGYIRGSRKAEALLGADIFLFPSYYGEGCPISLLEAMAAGLAIVATPVGGIPDIFVDGVNGILMDEVSPEAIAKAVKTLLEDDVFLDKVKKHNLKQAWEKYEANLVSLRVEEMCMKALNWN